MKYKIVNKETKTTVEEYTDLTEAATCLKELNEAVLEMYGDEKLYELTY